uniref:Telomere length regulation protein conserved domain-containing protein n=1 Tax=Rhodosorus marinus TaxID=101924 RepID=A0A7S3E977_9RHOD|mmetsp:Transcript_1886/g.7121  ORF Transcript_1886/g.7121 Transcript_1886/m.7121 type:complete len:861 (+) Transcript_1886:256-2838(+)|eukprot:CAMPEP_0113954594 /NCGR_PEP_ID=MMETSP0011_2-20120614/671_1 /TAXON_ID=101924 /ORGANISM="Rhodosorus marinus" /LENGTH=860 /DNA_ID=CAMNT_0000963803 /DNA_START=3281 /DNA_END=5863 /DNA_ORIENTATION=+ /assembly_acc=CAM_ASM_000156
MEEARELFLGFRGVLKEAQDPSSALKNVVKELEYIAGTDGGADHGGYDKQTRSAFIDRYLDGSISLVLEHLVEIEEAEMLEGDLVAQVEWFLFNLRAPASSFYILTTFLRTSKDSGAGKVPFAIVEILERYVSKSHRLSRVIEDLDCKDEATRNSAISALVTLPDRVANILRQAPAVGSPLGENEYFQKLAKALWRSFQLNTQRSVIPTIIDRVTSSGGGRTASLLVRGLLQSAGSTADPGSRATLKLGKLLAETSTLASELILRSLIAFPSKFMEKVLLEFLKESETGLHLAGAGLVLKRPILKGSDVNLYVSSASRASESSEVLNKKFFLRSVILSWSQTDVSSFGDLPMERQRTRVVLLWLRSCRKEEFIAVEDQGLILADGIQRRLQSPDKRIRFLGMVVGEGFSNVVEHPEKLRFDYDSDDRLEDEELELRSLSLLGDTGVVPVPGASKHEDHRAVEENPQQDRDDCRSLEDSDTESLEAYDLSDDSEQESLLKKQVYATSSIFRLLNLIRDFNRGEENATDPKLLLEALNSVDREAKRRSPSAVHYSPELSRSILAVSPGKFPPEEEKMIEKARSSSLENLVQLDIGRVGDMLITKIIYGTSSVLSLRSEALRLLSRGARLTCDRFEREKDGAADVVSMDIKGATEGEKKAEETKVIGKVIRRNERALAKEKLQQAKVRNRFAGSAWDLFQSLSWGLRGHGGVLKDAESDHRLPIRLDGQDTSLLSQIMATLSVFTSCAGPQCLERDRMAEELAMIALSRHDAKEAVVRRASMLALGSAVDALSSHSLLDLQVRLAKDNVDIWELLQYKAEFDPDNATRRFAMSSSARWASKVSTAEAAPSKTTELKLPWLNSP